LLIWQKNSFGLYHAHAYLLDDMRQITVNAGAGEIGRQMVEEGWVIFMDDESIVAQAANSRKGQIVNNVRENPAFLPNPLLPNTSSELAIPMVVGQKLVGVFDVQSDRNNAFTEEDLRLYYPGITNGCSITKCQVVCRTDHHG
jgi:putative methionine-R-sulfoxide reductase with GAF domain